MSFRLTLGSLALMVSVAGVSSSPPDMTVWQGRFETPALNGAMEMVAAGSGAAQRLAVRFAVNRQTVDANVRETRLSSAAASFTATLGGRTYKFEGTRHGNRWMGKLRAGNAHDDEGVWRLIAIDLQNRASSPDDPLPPPTGRLRVARTVFHWIDETRPELETRDPDDRRQVVVYVFYPTDGGGQRAAYMPDADAMRSAWGDALTDHVRSLRAHSEESAGLSRRLERYHVVLFAPGAGQKVLGYTSLLEELASHGYVVAALELPYNAPAMQVPGGAIIRKLSPAERSYEQPATLEQSRQLTHAIVVQWGRDLRFAIDRLAGLDRGDGLFARRLDLDRVAAIGHSFGGLAAGTVRLLDARVSGAINLDGNLTGPGFEYISPPDAGRQPFMWIEGPYEPPTAAALQQAGLSVAQWDGMYAEGDRQMRALGSGGLRVTITRVDLTHMDFSDQPLWNADLSPEARAGKLRTLALTRAYVRAFVDGCVAGRWRDMRRLITGAGGKDCPDLDARVFGAPWSRP